jgi:hypothetical protein
MKMFLFCLGVLLIGVGLTLADESPIRPNDGSSSNPITPAKGNDKSPLSPAKSNDKNPLASPKDSQKSPMQPAREGSDKSPTKSAEPSDSRSPINPTEGASVAPKSGGPIASEESSLQRPKTNFTAVGIKNEKSSKKIQERRGNKH